MPRVNDKPLKGGPLKDKPPRGTVLQRCFQALSIFLCTMATAAGHAQIAAQNNPHGKTKNACGDCHTTKSWSPLRLDIKFKHESTGFGLEGRHALTRCKKCHASLLFTGASRNCKSCHIDTHDGTLGVDCARCHTFQSWQDVSRVTALHQTTRFPLHGRHQHTGCDDCHRVQNESQFINMPLNCYSCHQQDYATASDPNHQGAGFAMNCEQCHAATSEAWAPATFAHPSTFPLTFGHANTSCLECHGSQFKGTSADCYACHRSSFESTRDPDHRAVGYSTDCRACHTTQDWQGSTIDHSFFPLRGAHAAAGCNSCHVNNRFQGTPRDCFICHQADFQQPTNPNHVTLNFSHDCTACHTMSAWMPATFDHDPQYFPIYSGPHRGKWQSCSTCHVDANNYKVFECIVCHEHNQTKMDEKHLNKVRDYQYNSAACYHCHPDGRK